jgi:acetyl-CoA carboxylase biotin carboxyl carrier protein
VGANVKTRLPGSVWQVLVKPGDQVTAGEVLFVLEVMKTEVPHPAPIAGRVDAVKVTEGDSVDADVVAVVLK